jgi:penicillin-binding protein 2A
MKRKGTLAAISILTAVLFAFIGYMFILFLGSYVIDEKKFVMNSAATLVDETGRELTRIYVENRDLVSNEDIPEHVKQAFIAVEDARFYEHHGIDIKAIGRALYKDLLAGSKVEGGSTITQQLAKNVFLSNDKTWMRKTKEVIISLNLEKRYTKQKILEMYLNQIYFGHGAYGIQAASQLYFNKPVSELTIEQGSLLAALPKAPTTYSPLLHPDKSLQRRNIVLELMRKANYLTSEQTVRLQGRTLALNIQQQVKEPAFLTYLDMVMEEAEKKFSISSEDLLRGGYKITVPMNATIQKTAYELFQKDRYFPGTAPGVQGAFVLMDRETGGVLSVIGGRDYVQKGLNRVQVKRQPGSTFKPLAVYAPALQEKMFQPYSLLEDKPFSYDGYIPRNIDGQYKGTVTMYDALVHSTNAPAVWALHELGINVSKQYLTKLGLSIEDDGLAMALGGLREGISPLSLVSAYRSFANEGKTVEPFFIQKIEDRQGNILAETSLKEKKVFSKQTAWHMTKMLEAVVLSGTAKAGQFEGALAGKTGTTSYPGVKGGAKDTWFVGYTNDVVGTVWMGYDKTDQQHYLTKGSSYPTTLFKDILMQSSLKHAAAFTQPKDVRNLPEPIKLQAIEDLSSDIVFKPLGLFTVRLTWTPSQDQRVMYDIYEVNKEGSRLVGKVEGKGTYDIERVNLFNRSSFYIVPYNELTKQQGIKSNEAVPAFLPEQSAGQ